MKTLAELQAIRDKVKNQVELRDSDENSVRVVVGLATCGIAAGARPVLKELSNLAQGEGGSNVTVTQTGCIGLCQYEPIVEVFEPGKEKITYIKINPAKARRIFDEHIIGGKVVSEYTVSSSRLAE